MGKFFDEIQDEHIAFIRKQKMFFVGSAPLAEDGHVNISPKGYDSFYVGSSSQVAYLDLTGSGNETSAHLLENGRITIMFTAFEGTPNILRLYGTGRTILPEMEEWEQWNRKFDNIQGARQIIVIDVHKVQTSCGYGVPLYDYKEDRNILKQWADKKGTEGVHAYQHKKNQKSIDGVLTPLGEKFQASE